MPAVTVGRDIARMDTLSRIAGHEQRIVRVFRTKAAVAGHRAKSLRELGLQDTDDLRRLVLTSVIRRAGPDRYFLDEPVWAARRQLRGSTIVRILLVLGLALATVAILARGS